MFSPAAIRIIDVVVVIVVVDIDNVAKKLF